MPNFRKWFFRSFQRITGSPNPIIAQTKHGSGVHASGLVTQERPLAPPAIPAASRISGFTTAPNVSRNVTQREGKIGSAYGPSLSIQP